MSAQTILSTKATSKFSKGFYVPKGSVVVLSAFNFRCPDTDKELDPVSGTCAQIYKIHFAHNAMPQLNGCCVFDIFDEEMRPKFEYTELVNQCGDPWTLTAQDNIRILSVPGYYMYELCEDKDIGSAVILAEELTMEEAELLPQPLVYGEF